jgi:hypothetical protein
MHGYGWLQCQCVQLLLLTCTYVPLCLQIHYTTVAER